MAAILTNVGRALAITRLLGSGVAPTRLGWGTGTTAATAADVALQTPSAEARVTGTVTVSTTTNTNDTWTLAGTLTSASSQAVAELGVFDAASAGTLALHASFAALPLLAGDAITFTVSIVFG